MWFLAKRSEKLSKNVKTAKGGTWRVAPRSWRAAPVLALSHSQPCSPDEPSQTWQTACHARARKWRAASGPWRAREGLILGHSKPALYYELALSRRRPCHATVGIRRAASSIWRGALVLILGPWFSAPFVELFLSWQLQPPRHATSLTRRVDSLPRRVKAPVPDLQGSFLHLQLRKNTKGATNLQVAANRIIPFSFLTLYSSYIMPE